MMRKLLLLTFILWSQAILASISIISDLDDTIKITNSKNPVSAGINALRSLKTFTGIDQLYSSFGDYTNDLFILSASPSILKHKIKRDLHHRNFYPKRIILKKITKFEDRYDYKFREVQNLILNSSDDFILLGDDVGDDPEVYSNIQKKYPNRVLAIYIHVIRNRNVPENVIRYWGSHEVAIQEHLENRMSEERVGSVIESMWNERSIRSIFPSFAHCPKAKNTWAWIEETSFSDLVRGLSESFLKYCDQRKLLAVE